ncbi:MAG TPA: restriction endonuclease subunit S [Methanocorpusculum sp.]|nr:restriction endonuclease subunit S [Methanocorpusculum sp.]HJJ54343.1 restriction endonuclease subunit S [Methanocorpusculum sp.]
MNPQSAFSDDWKSYKLSEIITLIGGGTPKTTKTEYWGGDIPWLSVKDFNNDFRYVYTTEKTITRLGLEQSSTTLLQKDDIIISARGTVGETAMIPYPMAFNQSCYGIRAKRDLVNSIFLYYLLKTSIKSLKNNAHGSVFDTITRDTFDGISIDLPPLPVQKKIAAILSSLDDKIELNTRMNKVLEEIARALFQRWFVEFEFPDAEGKPYKSAGGKMVESEMGMVPEGWRVGTIGDIAKITMGQSPNGESYNELGIGEVFYQGRAEFGIRFPKRRLFTTEPKRMAEKGDVLLSVRAPVGDINIASEKCCIGRGLAAIQSTDNHPSFILYTLMDLKRELDVFNGEGTVFGSINKDSLHSISTFIPLPDQIDLFEKIASAIDLHIEMNYCEIERLQKIRDALLPKLMSGELEISA